MVHFVGAGCGAPDLITVRGARLLEQADVIIYAGSLVNPALLDYAKDDCAIYNSAKMTLEEVLEIIHAAEEAGKTTVRLHTGDPSLYGAIREQMDALDEMGISYDVCPGVTAAFGAAAALHLEYTLPDISQTLILTRMEGKTKVPDREQIELLAAHQSSMAIYLSAAHLRELSRRLITGGLSPETPAAICYKVSWPEEENYVTTVERLAETAAEHNITKTALVIVGEALSHTGYSRSKLYDPAFTTGFRQGKQDV